MKFNTKIVLIVLLISVLFLAACEQIKGARSTSVLPAECTSAGCKTNQVVCELDDGRKVCSASETACGNGDKLGGGNYGLGGTVIKKCIAEMQVTYSCSSYSSNKKTCETNNNIKCRWVNNKCVDYKTCSSFNGDYDTCTQDDYKYGLDCEYVQSSNKCVEKAIKPVCVDSDVTPEYPNGINIYTKGNVTLVSGDSMTDLCMPTYNDRVIEFYCTTGGTIPSSLEVKICPTGYTCQDGACVKNITTTPVNIDTIKITTSSPSTFNLIMPLRDGNLSMTYCYKNSSGVFKLGGFDDAQFVTDNGITLKASDVGGNILKDLKGTRFLYSFGNPPGSTITGHSHVIEITRIDTTLNTTDFRVLDTGKNYEDKIFYPNRNTTFTFLDHNFTLMFLSDSIRFESITDNHGILFSKYGMGVKLHGKSSWNQDIDNCDIIMAENDIKNSRNSGIVLSQFNLKVFQNGVYTGINLTNGIYKDGLKSRTGDIYLLSGNTQYGTNVEYYNEHKSNDYVQFVYPEKAI